MSKGKPKANFFQRVLAESEAAQKQVPIERLPAEETSAAGPTNTSAAPAEGPSQSLDKSATGTRLPGGFMGRLVRDQNANMMEEVEAANLERDKAIAELAELRRTHGSKLMSWDPGRVAPSPYARRLPIAFTDKAFIALTDDIKRVGGNHTPVLVRRYTGPHPKQFDWEIIAGHRRRASCVDAGVEVIILERDASTEEVIRLMASENGKREPESSLELGLHFRKLLADGVAKSERHLAELTDTSRTSIQRYLKMTEIDPYLIDAFIDPREIRVEWVQPLIDVWASDSDGVRTRLKALRSSNSNPSSLAVFKAAINAERTAAVKPQTLRIGDKVVVKISSNAAGLTTVQFTKHAPPDLIEQVLAQARTWHKNATGEDEGSP